MPSINSSLSNLPPLSEITISVLGQGVTAQAVIAHAEKLSITLSEPKTSDLIITSPGIDPKTFPDYSAPIISDIEWAFYVSRTLNPDCQWIGITGTNGKTTVTSLISHLTQCPSVGNIGTPPISLCIPDIMPSTFVAEISSFQLETCVNFCPNIAVMLPITPDHLDRHGTMTQYQAEKYKLIRHCSTNDHLVYCDEDPVLKGWAAESSAQCWPISMSSPQTSSDWVPSNMIGEHNRLNIELAVQVASLCNVSVESIQERLITFTPPPHRLHCVKSAQHRRFFNDSKSTTPASTLTALKAFSDPVHLIVCGADKGIDLAPWIPQWCQLASSITCCGGLANRVTQAITEFSSDYPVSQCETLSDAIDISFNHSKPNDVILLSPSSSSFDQFSNYEHRGQVFTDYVNANYH